MGHCTDFETGQHHTAETEGHRVEKDHHTDSAEAELLVAALEVLLAAALVVHPEEALEVLLVAASEKLGQLQTHQTGCHHRQEAFHHSSAEERAHQTDFHQAKEEQQLGEEEQIQEQPLAFQKESSLL